MEVPPVDLYLVALRPPQRRLFPELTAAAKALSQALLHQPDIAGFVRRIAWLCIEEDRKDLRIVKEALFTRRRGAAAPVKSSQAQRARRGVPGYTPSWIGREGRAFRRPECASKPRGAIRSGGSGVVAGSGLLSSPDGRKTPMDLV